MIKPCDGARCESAYQDKLYQGKRVQNETKDGGYRCTVCAKVATGVRKAPGKK